MPRSKNVVAHHKRVKKILKQTKGYRGSRSKLYRTAKQSLMKSLQYAYCHRRRKKREFRRLWISRINAGVRLYGLSYSQFIYGLYQSNIQLNRKVLANISLENSNLFKEIVMQVKKVLN